MALIVNRECGMGECFDNYIRVKSVSFHINLNRQYEPGFYWDASLMGYLNKAARKTELLKEQTLDESKLSTEKLSKTRGIQSRQVRSILDMRIELLAQSFVLSGVSSEDEFLKYLYHEIKKHHAQALGSFPEAVPDDLEATDIKALMEETYGIIH